MVNTNNSQTIDRTPPKSSKCRLTAAACRSLNRCRSLSEAIRSPSTLVHSWAHRRAAFAGSVIRAGFMRRSPCTIAVSSRRLYWY